MDEILLLQLKDIDIRNIFHKRNSTLLEDRVSGCRLYVGCRASIKFLIFLLTRERGGEGRFCCSSLSLTGGTKVRRNENYIETKFQARLSLSLSLPLSRYRCLVTYFSITLLTQIPYRIASHYESIFLLPPPKDFQRLPLTKLHRNVSISNFIEFPGWSLITCFISRLYIMNVRNECCFIPRTISKSNLFFS